MPHEDDPAMGILLRGIKALYNMLALCKTCGGIGSVKDASDSYRVCPDCSEARKICNEWDELTT